MKSKEPQKIIVFDFDCTLANPKSRDFYANHTQKTLFCIATYHGLSENNALQVSKALKDRGLRHEMALFQSNILSTVIPEMADKPVNTQLLFDSLNEINPDEHFLADQSIVSGLRELHQDAHLALISNSPLPLVEKISTIIGLDLNNDFDYVRCYTPEAPMPKMLQAEDAFKSVKSHFNATQEDLLYSVGDTMNNDIIPAKAQGYTTIFLTEDVRKATAATDYTASDIHGAFKILKNTF